MDEAAHFLSETEGPQVADKVFEALAPSTAQFGDLARIIVCSTPYGEDGFFASLYAKAASGELAGRGRCPCDDGARESDGRRGLPGPGAGP